MDELGRSEVVVEAWQWRHCLEAIGILGTQWKRQYTGTEPAPSVNLAGQSPSENRAGTERNRACTERNRAGIRQALQALAGTEQAPSQHWRDSTEQAQCGTEPTLPALAGTEPAPSRNRRDSIEPAPSGIEQETAGTEPARPAPRPPQSRTDDS